MVLTVAALVLGSAASAFLLVATQRSRSAVERVLESIDPPRTHLLAAQRATDSGQAALTAAVSATGVRRQNLLTEAIARSRDVSSQWTKYRASSVGLPGEEALERKYLADAEAFEDVSSAALIPIVTSTGVGALPQEQFDRYDAVRDDLVELHSLYRAAERAALGDLGDHVERFQLTIAIGATCVMLFIVVAAAISMRYARRIVIERSERTAEARLVTFEGRLRRALELVDDTTASFEVADRAAREMLPGNRVSVMVADSSRAHLTPVSEPPACGVMSPEACPALRSTSSLRFPDSGALDACPVLAANTNEPCSATCVPVAITGRGAALLHLVGPVGDPPDERGAAHLVARGLGDRLTLLQALATYQLQAARDPLTGLLNRRSLEAAVAEVLADGKRYAVAFGDLDHFKQLNDLHGHETGDRALRAFARTLRESLRPQDITCRWGGEEFVVVLPDCDTTTAVDAMDRVRTNLALGSITGNTAAVTVSFGVAQSGTGESFDEIVERADTALHHAKDSGRNRVVGYELGLDGAIPAT